MYISPNRFFILFSLYFLLTTKISAQTTGIVMDASNKAPLPGANIFSDDSTLTITDQNGFFNLDIQNYPAKVQVSFIGYETLYIVIPEPAQNLFFELNSSNFMLGEVIVTAFVSNQSILEIPGSITLTGKKEIKIDNDVNFIPALNRATGVYAHSGTYNTNRITIRGIGSRSLFTTAKIRAYYENIPLTTGDGETNVEDIDPNLIDRMEIIKGPSSSLYGAGLGGTLLIKPKTPTNQEKYIKYQFTGGSYGYFKNSLSLDYGNNKNRIGINLNKIKSDGYRENNNFDRLSLGLSYKSYISSKTSLDLIFNYIDLYAQIPSSINKITYETNPRAAAQNWAEAEGFEDYKKLLSGLGVSHIFNMHSSINASIFYTFRDSYERRPFNILTDNTNALGSRMYYTYHAEWAQTQLDITIGGEYFTDFYKWQTIENDNKEEGDLLSDNKESRENLNTFLKADLTLKSGTFITAGINVNRTNYDYEDIYSVDQYDNTGSYSFGTSYSPRIAISHPVYKKIYVYGNISHGFSPPTLSETLTPDGSINPTIKPETGINYEIGSKGMTNNQKFYYDIAFFSMHVDNLIVAQRTGEDEFIGVNAGKTVNNGIEFSLNYNFLKKPFIDRSLNGFISYTLASYHFKEFIEDGNDYSGNQLTGVPGNLLNIGLAFKFPYGLYGNLFYQYVDEMPMRDDNSVFSDPYQLLNGKLGFNLPLSKHFVFDIYGIFNNIFNEKYASMISVNAASFGGNLPRYYYPGMPFNMYLGTEIRYNF